MNLRHAGMTALLIFSFLEAQAACSPEAKWMVSAAAECMQHQDPGCAKLKLDPLLEKEPTCAGALFIRGWIYQYFDGKLEKGKAMQSLALEIDPSLSDFWEKRGHAIESHLTNEAFSHFDLQFEGAEDRDKAWDAVKYLDDMYGHLGSIFQTFPPKRIPVIVFTTEEFMDAWRAPFIGGFFDKRDGKIRVRVDSVPGGDEEFRHRVRHELTHAFLYQLEPRESPSWVSEGVAEFYARSGSSDGFWKDNRLDQIRKNVSAYPWMSLDEIQEAISKKKVSPLRIGQAYLESEALVLWVAKERGDSWVPHVLSYWHAHGGAFEKAFEVVLGVTPKASLEELHHTWE